MKYLLLLSHLQGKATDSRQAVHCPAEWAQLSLVCTRVEEVGSTRTSSAVPRPKGSDCSRLGVFLFFFPVQLRLGRGRGWSAAEIQWTLIGCCSQKKSNQMTQSQRVCHSWHYGLLVSFWFVPFFVVISLLSLLKVRNVSVYLRHDNPASARPTAVTKTAGVQLLCLAQLTRVVASGQVRDFTVFASAQAAKIMSQAAAAWRRPRWSGGRAGWKNSIAAAGWSERKPCVFYQHAQAQCGSQGDKQAFKISGEPDLENENVWKYAQCQK